MERVVTKEIPSAVSDGHSDHKTSKYMDNNDNGSDTSSPVFTRSRSPKSVTAKPRNLFPMSGPSVQSPSLPSPMHSDPTGYSVQNILNNNKRQLDQQDQNLHSFKISRLESSSSPVSSSSPSFST